MERVCEGLGIGRSWAASRAPGRERGGTGSRGFELEPESFFFFSSTILNVIYQYALQHIEALLPPLSATSAAFVCLRNHTVDFLRNVALHDDFIYASCVLRH